MTSKAYYDNTPTYVASAREEYDAARSQLESLRSQVSIAEAVKDVRAREYKRALVRWGTELDEEDRRERHQARSQ